MESAATYLAGDPTIPVGEEEINEGLKQLFSEVDIDGVSSAHLAKAKQNP